MEVPKPVRLRFSGRECLSIHVPMEEAWRLEGNLGEFTAVGFTCINHGAGVLVRNIPIQDEIVADFLGSAFAGCQLDATIKRPSSRAIVQLLARLSVQDGTAVQLDAESCAYLEQHKIIVQISTDRGVVTATTLGGNVVTSFASDRHDLMASLSQNYNVVRL